MDIQTAVLVSTAEACISAPDTQTPIFLGFLDIHSWLWVFFFCREMSRKLGSQHQLCIKTLPSLLGLMMIYWKSPTNTMTHTHTQNDYTTELYDFWIFSNARSVVTEQNFSLELISLGNNCEQWISESPGSTFPKCLGIAFVCNGTTGCCCWVQTRRHEQL